MIWVIRIKYIPRFNSQIENRDWSGKYIGILINAVLHSNITLPINESIQQANFKACCGKRLCLFWWWLFSVVQLLFLVINLTEDGKLGVEFAILSVAFWSLLICGNLLCNWWKKFSSVDFSRKGIFRHFATWKYHNRPNRM